MYSITVFVGICHRQPLTNPDSAESRPFCHWQKRITWQCLAQIMFTVFTFAFKTSNHIQFTLPWRVLDLVITYAVPMNISPDYTQTLDFMMPSCSH